MLAKACAICLVLLVVSPVTAPFRTLDIRGSSPMSRATLSDSTLGDPAFVDDATLTTDPVLANTIRFNGVTLLAAAFAVPRLPLPDADFRPVRTSGASAWNSRITPVLRV